MAEDEKQNMIEKLQKKVSIDLKIDKEDLKNETEKNGIKYHYYLALYITEKKNLSKLNKLKRQLNQKLYHKYKFNNEYKLKTGPEMGTYIAGDSQMAQLSEMINNNEGYIEYLEKVLELFKMRSFAIKNIIDLVKLESGGFY